MKSLDSMMDRIRQESVDFRSLVVLHGGQTIHESYYQGCKVENLHPIYSCTKSICSLLAGIACGDDMDSFVEQQVFTLPGLPKIHTSNTDDRKPRIRIKHLLEQTAGFQWHETGRPWNPENDAFRLQKSENWIRYLLAKPMDSEPGERFVYNTGASHLLGLAAAERAGKNLDDLADERLFAPLGISSREWEYDPQGRASAGKGLKLTTPDLARIGQLILQSGKWEGKQIVPKAWLEKSLQMQSRGHIYYGAYGWQWWIRQLPPFAKTSSGNACIYCAIGYGGQFLFVVPDHELVMACNGWMPDRDFGFPQMLFRNHVLKAVVEG